MPKTFQIVFLLSFFPLSARADELKIGGSAPLFTLQNQDGSEFSLDARKGAGWTVLYFYPKAETPGCTKEACAFRDSIVNIRKLNAEVYGISTDTVEQQLAFHRNHGLQFDLLADPDGAVATLYGVKMPLITMAKRWTFIIDPDLRIAAIQKDVDPTTEPARVVDKLKELEQLP